MEDSILGPEIAGPNYWYQIHIMTKTLSDTKRFEAYWYFTHRILPELFPCDICRQHLRENLSKVTPLESYLTRGNLPVDSFTWSNQLHNVVNVMLQKPQLDLETARKLYVNHDPVRSFVTAWYIVHSATAKVGSNQTNRKLYSRLVNVIVPALMMTGDMRTSYMRLLRENPLPEKGLLEWSIQLRNDHGRLCGYPPINPETAIKRFGTECSKCKISH